MNCRIHKNVLFCNCSKSFYLPKTSKKLLLWVLRISKTVSNVCVKAGLCSNFIIFCKYFCIQRLRKVHLIQGRNYHLFDWGGGVFGKFALPNFIILCEMIGVRVQKSFFFGGGVCLPTSGVAARVVGGGGGNAISRVFRMKLLLFNAFLLVRTNCFHMIKKTARLVHHILTNLVAFCHAIIALALPIGLWGGVTPPQTPPEVLPLISYKAERKWIEVITVKYILLFISYGVKRFF